MADGVRVRPAGADDLPALVAIYNHAVEHTTATFDVMPFTVAQRQAWFAQFDDDHPLRVAAIADTIAGYAHYLPYRHKPAYARTVEATVYVAPRHHGRGVGTALYGELIASARRAGMHTMLGVIAGDNPASIALHQKHGFVPVGHLREVGWKFGNWVDTHYWQLLL